MGSILPYYEGSNCNLEGYEYAFDGRTTKTAPASKSECMVEHAYAFLNAPYLWGGKSPLGIDCSGFTQLVARIAGIKLMRDAYQQAEQGVTLGFIEEADTGDLVFFDNEDGRIIHVGVLINSREIIHASGKVRIDKIDHQGIYNEELGKYTHTLRLIKRIL
jgi:cell wall-associated NlpC family hydrolase